MGGHGHGTIFRGGPSKLSGGHPLDAPTVALGREAAPPARRLPLLGPPFAESGSPAAAAGFNCFSPPDAAPRLPPSTASPRLLAACGGRDSSSTSALALSFYFSFPFLLPHGPASVIKPQGLLLRLTGLRAGPSDENGRHSLSLTLRWNPLMHGINHRCQAFRPRTHPPGTKSPRTGGRRP